MLHPTTPTRADDEIPRLKQSLSAKWGIAFPERDFTWSPSRRDPNQPEERISTLIQFLYFRAGALTFAIEEFEKTAITIFSRWQFKPQGESDVIPSTHSSGGPPSRGFLRKRDILPHTATKELTECLLHHLSQVTDRVKHGEAFSVKHVQIKSTFDHVEMHTNPEGEPVTATKALSIEECSPIKPSVSRRQSSLTQWFRNKGTPGSSMIKPDTASQHSSDDYLDPEMAELLTDSSTLSLPALHPASSVTSDYPRRGFGYLTTGKKPEEPPTADPTETMSLTEETFETPPTSPPDAKKRDVGLGLGLQEGSTLEGSTMGFGTQQQDLTTRSSRKRPCPDPDIMKPPPLRRVSLEKVDRPSSGFGVPTPPQEEYKNIPQLSNSSHSFDNVSSVSSSFTSASPAWTSPNTSFGSGSVATSFDSASDETDTTVRPLIQPRFKQLVTRQSSESTLEPCGPWPNETITNYARSGDLINPDVMVVDEPPAQEPVIFSVPEANGPSILPMISAPTDTGKSLFERLVGHPLIPTPNKHSNVSLRQLYEVLRVATSCQLSVMNLSECLTENFESYDKLWTALTCAVANINDKPLPERSSLVAWDRALDNWEDVAIAGKLKFLDHRDGPVFEFCLRPLKVESSYRLARKYGHDRFCTMLGPSLNRDSFPSYLKQSHITARKTILKWLVETEHTFLRRTWRALFVKSEATRKAQKGTRNDHNDARYRITLFAEDGVDFRHGDARGEIDTRRPTHSCFTIEQVLEWFMSSSMNSDQLALKLFSRLAMGLTNTLPTLTFRPCEIIRSDDALSNEPMQRRLDFPRSDELKTDLNPQTSDASVMNDGCARMSKDAANAIANMLGMDQAPSVFQGRIGGAKGVWMVDALDERPSRLVRRDGKAYWIEISNSQLKFKPHAVDAFSPDKDRITFEVYKFSKKLSSSSLNFQLIPILENRGVPQEVFRRLLREDLSSRVGEMEIAMEDRLSLRKWNQDTNPVSEERARYGGIEMVGGLPESTAEKINWFVEHGFEPKTCLFLKNQLWKSIRAYCTRLENRMNIGLGRSTMAYMIADPLAVLAENEVHIGFSNMFRDSKSGFNENMLHDVDVLVARLPAHLPSDIQKVRAVFKPELRIYRDIVVFSSRGEVSLACKLSGGDYDGDTAWICWDPDIVDPFENAMVPLHAPPESYGIEKDNVRILDLLLSPNSTNSFLSHAFDFNMQMSMLGVCTKYHEALCYHNGTIESSAAIEIAILLGNLVDSAKGGFKFDDTKWKAYLNQLGLPKNIEPPAYKDKRRSREKSDNLIDQLVFHVAKEEREKALKSFTERFEVVSPWDEDLVRLQKEEVEEARTNKSLHAVLLNLKASLEAVFDYWKEHAKREDDEEDLPSARTDNVSSFRGIVEKCRADFVAIKPKIDETLFGESSDRIRRWQQDHLRGKVSYWDLLKASVAFHHFHKSVAFIWYVAGIELGEIKATRGGRASYRTVVNPVHSTLKMDGKLNDGAKRREMQMEELRKAKIHEEEEEDEFGSDLDMMEL